ncbi:site-2 protease family protein [Halorussus salilacus]|uniref:site-2 protease family protein n=1 Tax=Halorussus salilacus TaxID=2953750 RepID=UPI00209DA737|nr:site-2 protease family protein [Halorussus salilacus]USZ67370.1 site-2 protease family protein [Halorussus salilacus]
MRNYDIASVWGIPIRINISLIVFLPVLAWLIGSGEQIAFYADIIDGFAPATLDRDALAAGNTPWLVGSAAAVGLFASVAVHELGHAWAARRYGIHTESITLWLLGGLASLQSMPREWNRELWIALAGPAASVVTAAACYAVVLALPGSVPVATFVFGWLVVTNVVLTVFNLLPAFPMDGGRVLRALLARSQPYATATRTAARIGSLFALGFAILGVLSFSPLLLLLALFVYAAATSESRLVALDALLDGVTAADAMTAGVEGVAADESISALLDRMMTERRTTYPVTEAGSVVGVVSLGDLRAKRNREATTVGQVVDAEVPRVERDLPLFEVIALMNRSGADAAVVEERGETVGVITAADLATALQVRREAGSLVSPRAAM